MCALSFPSFPFLYRIYLYNKLGTHINLFGGGGLDTDWFAEDCEVMMKERKLVPFRHLWWIRHENAGAWNMVFGGSPSWSFDQCVSLFVCISSFFTLDAIILYLCFLILVGFCSNLFKAFTWLGVSVGSCFINLILGFVIALTSEANVEQILYFNHPSIQFLCSLQWSLWLKLVRACSWCKDHSLLLLTSCCLSIRSAWY